MALVAVESASIGSIVCGTASGSGFRSTCGLELVSSCRLMSVSRPSVSFLDSALDAGEAAGVWDAPVGLDVCWEIGLNDPPAGSSDGTSVVESDVLGSILAVSLKVVFGASSGGSDTAGFLIFFNSSNATTGSEGAGL